MITGYFGLPGSGKTYKLVQIARHYQKKGMRVFSNFKILGSEYYTDFKEIIKEKKCVILIDEANLFLPSRLWTKIPVSMLYRLSQSRKFETDIYYTSQSPARIDKVLRELTNFYGHCRKIIGSLHRISYYWPEEWDKEKRKKLWSEWFFIRKKFYKLYDTKEILNVPDYFLD